MTDPHDDLPTDPLDDLASAHLDGESTAAEAARIGGDPDLTARVGARAAARAALRAPDAPVDDARREAAISAALAAFDATGVELPGEADRRAASATPITVAASRRPMSRRTLRLVTAAAVAVLLALAVPLLGRLDSGGSEDDLATSSLDDADQETQERSAAGDDAASGGAAPEAPAAADALSSANQAYELGTFRDLASLEAAVRPLLSSSEAPAPAASTTAADGSSDAATRCADAPEGARAGPRVLTATATLDARLVVVFVHEGPDGEHELVVLEATDCSLVTSGTISE
jgi:hypothetical protein